MTVVNTVLAVGGAFAVTNIDDFIVLTTLFATSGRGGPARRDIVVGQYVGIAALLLVSVLAALALQTVPDRWIGLLGLVPIALGIRGLLLTAGDDAQRGPALAVPVRGVVGVVAVTVANGADNLSVYTPLLRHDATAPTVAIYVAVFAVLVAVWCVVASFVAGRQKVVDLVDATGHWFAPTVFILIGLFVVLTSGLLRG